ncbi:hypothetical protein [Xanthomonas sp. WHRI 8356]
MPRLAESSVVIAFRDWQWLNRCADATIPPLMIVMEGTPESKLGDLQISASERLFLLEVKSTEDTIQEEWTKVKSDKSPNPKQLFRKTCQLLDSLGNCYDESDEIVDQLNHDRAMEVIGQSIACHHFLYWDKATEDFRIEPYLTACRRKQGFTKENLATRKIAIKNRGIAIETSRAYTIGSTKSPPHQDESIPINFKTISFISPHMLNEKSARLIHKDANYGDYSWDFLGLQFDEFHSYIQDMCEGESFKTNCVLLSTSGKIFAHIVDTADLLSLLQKLDPKIESTSSPVSHNESADLRFASKKQKNQGPTPTHRTNIR